MKKINLFVALSVTLSLLVGVFVGREIFPSSGSGISGLPQKINLPADADLFIPCIPGHGSHYSRAQDIATGITTRPWVGPSYIVNEGTGEVVGVEYHISAKAIADEGKEIEDALTRIISGEDLKLLYKHKFPVFGANFESVDILYIAGHPGFEVAHYDVHLWLMPAADHANISCPEGTRI